MKTKIYLSIILLLFSSCIFNKLLSSEKGDNNIIHIKNTTTGLWKNHKNMILKKVLEIGIEEGDENYIFSGPCDIAIDSYGNIYICDIRDNCVKKYSSEGIFIQKFGRKGQGPGDLDKPREISIDEKGLLYILELKNRRISIFDSNGNFISIIPLTELSSYPVSNLAVNFKTSDIYVSIIYKIYPEIDPAPKLIFQINRNGDIIRSFGKAQALRKLKNGYYQFPTPKIMNLVTGEIICCFNYLYEIYLFDNLGFLTKIISLDDPAFKNFDRIDEGRFGFYQSQGTIGPDPLIFPDGKFMIGSTDHGSNYLKNFKRQRDEIKKGNIIKISHTYKTHYDLYNKKGELLQRFDDVIDENIIRIDSHGYGYSLCKGDGYPKICKYRITFKKIK
jgi:hypothetical protein